MWFFAVASTQAYPSDLLPATVPLITRHVDINFFKLVQRSERVNGVAFVLFLSSAVVEGTRTPSHETEWIPERGTIALAKTTSKNARVRIQRSSLPPIRWRLLLASCRWKCLDQQLERRATLAKGSCVRALVSIALQCCYMLLFLVAGVEILVSAPERRWAPRTSPLLLDSVLKRRWAFHTSVPRHKKKLPAFCRAGRAGRKCWSFQLVPPSRPEPMATVHMCTVRALTQDAVSFGYGVLVYARLCPLLCSAVTCFFS